MVDYVNKSTAQREVFYLPKNISFVHIDIVFELQTGFYENLTRLRLKLHSGVLLLLLPLTALRALQFLPCLKE